MFIIVWFVIMFLSFLIKNKGIPSTTRTLCIGICVFLTVAYVIFGVALG